MRDDLRMMASKPVAAKAGGVKHYAECIGLYMCLSRNWCRLFFDWVLVSGVGFTQINADNLRAAEVCSAEATELPVWERPPVSVANGLCHPWALDPGSSHPTKPLRALARTPTARDDTAL